LLLATRAFHAASVLNAKTAATLPVVEIKKYIKQLIEFDFLTEVEVQSALNEAERFWRYVQTHSILPPVNLKDERTMQKGRVKKKLLALERIKARRSVFLEAESADELEGILFNINEDDDMDQPAHVEIPNTVKDLKRKELIRELMNDQKGVNMEAYGAMEWWRLPVSTDVNSLPRIEFFPHIGNIVKKVVLCLPSSAPAERVFSILKLVLSKQDYAKLRDNYELACWLLCNDLDV